MKKLETMTLKQSKADKTPRLESANLTVVTARAHLEDTELRKTSQVQKKCHMLSFNVKSCKVKFIETESRRLWQETGK